MIPYPDIGPNLFKLGPLQIRWYGLMYLFGFASSYWLVLRQVKTKESSLTEDDVTGFYTWGIMGLLVGARIGYVLFYNLPFYLENPMQAAFVWEGGMSFHGGLIGSIVAGLMYARRRKIPPLELSDIVMPTIPLGLFFGRAGNFINGELYGRATDLPWAMVFPLGGDIARHPSQLYEAAVEGPILFAILWITKERFPRQGGPLGLFLLLYGVMRFAVEFVREPDIHLGLVFGPFTMGQFLCLLMTAAGTLMLAFQMRGARENEAGQ